MRLRSLKNKLALVFCGITLAVMAGVWVCVVPPLESNLREQRRADLRRVALATVDSLERYHRSRVIRLLELLVCNNEAQPEDSTLQATIAIDGRS